LVNQPQLVIQDGTCPPALRKIGIAFGAGAGTDSSVDACTDTRIDSDIGSSADASFGAVRDTTADLCDP